MKIDIDGELVDCKISRRTKCPGCGRRVFIAHRLDVDLHILLHEEPVCAELPGAIATVERRERSQ